MGLSPFLVVLAVSASLAAQKGECRDDKTTLLSQLKAVNETSRLIQAMGPERALGTLYTAYSMQRNPLASELLKVVEQKRKAVDEAIQGLSTWLVDDDDKHNPNLSTKEVFKKSLQQQRSVSITTSAKDSFLDFYTDRTAHFVRWIGKVVNGSPIKSTNLTAYYLLIAAKEQFGIERGSGVYLFANGTMRHEVHAINVGHRQQAFAFLDLIEQLNLTPIVREQLGKRYVGSKLDKDLTAERVLLNENKPRKPSVPEGKTWVDNTTKFIDIIQDIEMMLLNGIIESLRNGDTASN